MMTRVGTPVDMGETQIRGNAPGPSTPTMQCLSSVVMALGEMCDMAEGHVGQLSSKIDDIHGPQVDTPKDTPDISLAGVHGGKFGEVVQGVNRVHRMIEALADQVKRI